MQDSPEVVTVIYRPRSFTNSENIQELLTWLGAPYPVVQEAAEAHRPVMFPAREDLVLSAQSTMREDTIGTLRHAQPVCPAQTTPRSA